MIRRLGTQLIVLAFGAVALLGLSSVSTVLADHVPSATAATPTTLATTRAQLADAQRQLQRTQGIIAFSTRYAIPADLSAQIYDIAAEEGIPASIGFQLVKVESGFQNGAQSSASAIGLTQLRLATARSYDATVDEADLMNASTNLRLGFRYLKDLMNRFGQNVPLALEAYNKGPTFVSAETDSGYQVRGRYSRAVLAGLPKYAD